MRSIAKLFYRNRNTVIAVIILLTAWFAFNIRIQPDNSLREYFSDNDFDYTRFEEFQDIFDTGRYLIVLVESDRLFDPDVLEYISWKTEDLLEIEHVMQVHSLASANKITGLGEGLSINPLLSDLSEEKIPWIRETAMNDTLFCRYLVSTDGRYTAIVLSFDIVPGDAVDHIVNRAEQIMDEDRPEGINLHYTGDMKMVSEYNMFTMQNQTVFPLLVALFVVVILLILYRSLSRLLITMAVICISLIWTLGFYSMLGLTFNVITGMLVPLVLILSVADSIHIIEYFDEQKGKTPEKAFVSTFSYITVPCLLTSVTTSLGLYSLTVSRIKAVATFGQCSAAGIMFAFIVSVTIVPWFMLHVRPVSHKKGQSDFWNKLLGRCHRLTLKNEKNVALFCLLLFVFADVGILRIRIETDDLQFFPKDGAFYKDSSLLDSHFSGYRNIEILLEEGDFQEPAVLNRIDNLCRGIEALENVQKVISLPIYVKRINKALNSGQNEEYKIPDTKDLVAQELFLFTFSDDGRDELHKIATSDFSKLRVLIKAKTDSSKKMLELCRRIESLSKKTFADTGIRSTVTGSTYLYSVIYDMLLESQIKGFITAFILVLGLLFIFFRSLRYWLLSIIPNLLPIVYVLGVMGWLDITLNVGTVMIASVALGIAVDDTIHFITRFRHECGKHDRLENTLEVTTINVGKAVVFTSLINIGGFLVLLSSSFKPTREFGALTALTLLIALLSDVFVLPALILMYRKHFVTGASNTS